MYVSHIGNDICHIIEGRRLRLEQRADVLYRAPCLQLSVALVRVSGTIIGFRGATAIVVARRADLRLSQ